MDGCLMGGGQGRLGERDEGRDREYCTVWKVRANACWGRVGVNERTARRGQGRVDVLL